MLWLFILYQASGVSGPPPTDPGNDPGFTVLATVIFVLVSLGGGVLAFRFYNPKNSSKN
ncbi:MAG TPA: hypothetical protein VH186_26475 [Chloroflexia bacterium]|nr:hypothetical protein [Chloroflexia bacterium]